MTNGVRSTSSSRSLSPEIPIPTSSVEGRVVRWWFAAAAAASAVAVRLCLRSREESRRQLQPKLNQLQGRREKGNVGKREHFKKMTSDKRPAVAVSVAGTTAAGAGAAQDLFKTQMRMIKSFALSATLSLLHSVPSLQLLPSIVYQLSAALLLQERLVERRGGGGGRRREAE